MNSIRNLTTCQYGFVHFCHFYRLLKKNKHVNRSCIKLSKLSGVGESPTENALSSNVSRSPLHGRSIKKSESHPHLLHFNGFCKQNHCACNISVSLVGCMFQPRKQDPLCLKRGVIEPIKHTCEASMIPDTWNYKGQRVKDVHFDAKGRLPRNSYSELVD